jgi:hypothetical protein
MKTKSDGGNPISRSCPFRACSGGDCAFKPTGKGPKGLCSVVGIRIGSLKYIRVSAAPWISSWEELFL